ncbi:hypothetical protein, partial [Aestuariivita boseongensis]|uniref:hypothetical protein n=1 Tax=Aestuariivita boseongensis TaxID=1470562 RepID=UPI001C10ABD9
FSQMSANQLTEALQDDRTDRRRPLWCLNDRFSQHLPFGTDASDVSDADEAVHELPALEQALACRDVMRRKTTAFILAWPDCVG